jgi:hypothetical protein
MEPDRPTLPLIELKDNLIYPAPKGARVLALNIGGVLTQAIVTSDFNQQFDAWMEYPQVPASVKARKATLAGWHASLADRFTDCVVTPLLNYFEATHLQNARAHEPVPAVNGLSELDPTHAA